MVKTGLDVLCDRDFDGLHGKRLGLVTNQTGVAAGLRSNVEVLWRETALGLVALFAPEHGLQGIKQAGVPIADERDRRTGLPIHSIYGVTVEQLAERFRELDAVLFDLQDVGARYFTYIATLRLVLHAAWTAGVEVIVLDRPNPLGGLVAQGLPPFEEHFRSLVSCAPVPIRHGLTAAEFAGWLVHDEAMDVDLRVVPTDGWSREMCFDDTGLPWVPPSPNMPTPDTARVYPATCMLEGTNLSEGRGTTKPFEWIGAPWLDGQKLADRLNETGLRGIVFRFTAFVPTFSKHAGERCEGVQLHVTDRDEYRGVRTGLTIVSTLLKDAPEFRFLDGGQFDRLLGTSSVREALLDGESPGDLEKEWEPRIKAFRTDSRRYRLYE